MTNKKFQQKLNFKKLIFFQPYTPKMLEDEINYEGNVKSLIVSWNDDAILILLFLLELLLHPSLLNPLQILPLFPSFTYKKP